MDRGWPASDAEDGEDELETREDETAFKSATPFERGPGGHYVAIGSGCTLF